MRTHPRHILIALILGAAISATWLNAVVVGMQSPSQPGMHTIELPTVVVIAHKASATQATAQSKPTAAKSAG